MGLPLTHPGIGSLWFNAMNGNLTTLENQFVGRQKSDSSIVTVSGTTAETVLMTSTTIPGNTLAAGMVLALMATGTVRVPATSTPSITLRMRWGGVGGTLLWTSTWNYASNPSAYDIGWFNQNWILCVTAGASGTVEQGGWAFTGNTFAGGINTGLTTIDTTTDKQLVWTVQPSLSTVTVTQRLMVVNRG